MGHSGGNLEDINVERNAEGDSGCVRNSDDFFSPCLKCLDEVEFTNNEAICLAVQMSRHADGDSGTVVAVVIDKQVHTSEGKPPTP